MIPGGPPQGTGTGGPGYQIKAEFDAPHLDRHDTACGRTADAESAAVVKAIGDVRTGAGDRPVEPVTNTRPRGTRTPRP